MIDISEHFYEDDPNVGHPDACTRLKDAFYFFLGNGLIKAAIQISPLGGGSPYGVIIMPPDKLSKKRDSFTYDIHSGFEKTMLAINIEGHESFFPEKINAKWSKNEYPEVLLNWNYDNLKFEERFYCRDNTGAALIRHIRIDNKADKYVKINLMTGVTDYTIHRELKFHPNSQQEFTFEYKLNEEHTCVKIAEVFKAEISKDYINYWEQGAGIDLHDDKCNRFFRASSHQLYSAISQKGIVDASIWQYNNEWVRDHSFMAMGLTLAGHHEKAAILLNRLLNEFVNKDGDTIDSGVKREPDDVELDQNGILLYALKTYYLWTGDLGIIRKNWDIIKKAAEFPLKDEFYHAPSGMLCNAREFWERHSAHGIKPGIELAYQIFTVIGLQAAAFFANKFSENKLSQRWTMFAKKLKQNMLTNPKYAMINNNRLIKRRELSGAIQYRIEPDKEAFEDFQALAKNSKFKLPLFENTEHFLCPDSSQALPIVYNFIDPLSDLSNNTLLGLESLWNQDWQTGGYGRYHISSEPDSPGAWTFPSIFIARACIESGKIDRAEEILNWLNALPGGKSAAWFEMYGQKLSPPFPQVGITPWIWAEMIMLFMHHIIGFRPQEDHILIKPSLLKGMEKANCSIPVRNKMIDIDIREEPSVENLIISGDIDHTISGTNEVMISYPTKNLNLQIILPQIT